MTKPELMKVFEAAVDDAIRTKMWGEITVLFEEGNPAIMKQERTTKLEGGNETNHAKRNRY